MLFDGYLGRQTYIAIEAVLICTKGASIAVPFEQQVRREAGKEYSEEPWRQDEDSMRISRYHPFATDAIRLKKTFELPLLRPRVDGSVVALQSSGHGN